MGKFFSPALIVVVVGLFVCAGKTVIADHARNIILVIGDGMGLEQVYAAHCYLGSNLFFESWTSQAEIATASADDPVTDSAAAGSAMATGNKVDNGVISVARPGDDHELRTALEYFKTKGKRAGLVTTSFMTDATPSAFGAHETSRSYTSQIAHDYLYQTRPNVFFGGGENGLNTSDAIAAGFQVVTNRAEMQALDTPVVTNVSGQFGSGSLPYEYDGLGEYPHLSEMTTTALSILTNAEQGFFLMVEGGLIDHACHANDLALMIPEVLELNHTLRIILDWAETRTDTLVIVTADHETGGLTVTRDNGAGNLPDVTWETEGHSSDNVGAWAWGPGAEWIAGTMSNTALNHVMLAASLPPALGSMGSVSSSEISTHWEVYSGEVYQVEYSTNLIQATWQPLVTCTADTTRLDITDLVNTNSSEVYYRARTKVD